MTMKKTTNQTVCASHPVPDGVGLCQKAHAVHTDSAAAVQWAMDVCRTQAAHQDKVIDARQALCSVARKAPHVRLVARPVHPVRQEEALLALRAPERTVDHDHSHDNVRRWPGRVLDSHEVLRTRQARVPVQAARTRLVALHARPLLPIVPRYAACAPTTADEDPADPRPRTSR